MFTAKSGSKCDHLASENLDNDHKNLTEKNNSRTDNEKNEQLLESENNGLWHESDEENLIFGHDSNSERSHADYDYEHVTEDEATGSGDRLTGTNISPYNESPRRNVDIRHRGHQDAKTELASLESDRQDQPPTELSVTNDGLADLQKEGTSHGGTLDEEITMKVLNIHHASSFWDWFIFIVPKTVCIICLSIIYLLFAILSIKILHFSAKKT